MFHLVRSDSRRLITGNTGQIYGPIGHAARGTRYRPRCFCGAQQSRTHRFADIADRRSRVGSRERAMDAMFGIDSDSPRAIGLALTTACGTVTANYRRRRAGAIHAAWNLLDPRAAQALAAALSGFQIAETESDLSTRPCRNEIIPPAKIDHFVFDRDLRPRREIDRDE